MVQIVQIGDVDEIDRGNSNWRMLYKLADEDLSIKLVMVQIVRIRDTVEIVEIVEIIDGCWQKIVGEWGFKIQNSNWSGPKLFIGVGEETEITLVLLNVGDEEQLMKKAGDDRWPQSSEELIYEFNRLM